MDLKLWENKVNLVFESLKGIRKYFLKELKK